MKTREEVSEFLDDVFEFQIGEVVYLRDSTNDLVGVPNKFVITERFLQQCHGGVQRLYQFSRDKHQLVAEVAITRDRPEFDPRATLERNLFDRQWWDSVLESKRQGDGASDED